MYDLIVVGAGPSGSSAARRAGMLGMKVLLLEKQKMPRMKPCGGAVSEYALSFLDFPIPRGIVHHDIYGARIHYGGKSITSMKPGRIAILTKREEFDKLLADKAVEAGVTLLDSIKTTTFAETSSAVEVMTDSPTSPVFRGRYLIIAEGAQGTLKSKIRSADRKKDYAITAVCRIKKEANQEEHIKKCLDIYFGTSSHGYAWVFPLKDHLSVGIGGLADRFRNPREHLRKFLDSHKFSTTDMDEEIRIHMIPSGGVRRKYGRGRVLLCGDAAGFVDSFLGEGIAYAIRSGQLAAESVFSRIGSTSVDIVDDYRKRIHREIFWNLYFSRKFSLVMHRYPGIFIKLLARNQAVLDKYLDIPLHKISYGQYIRWFFPRAVFLFFRT